MEEQAKILVELGNDAEGSEMRAKMMSASLLSDMEAFKVSSFMRSTNVHTMLVEVNKTENDSVQLFL